MGTPSVRPSFLGTLLLSILSFLPASGHFAVKKIAVGQSPAYLLNILQEVRVHVLLKRVYLNLHLGAVAGEIASSKYNYISPYMARDMPVLVIWTQSPDIAVR